MAKRKNDDILANLDALKPGIPTNTRPKKILSEHRPRHSYDSTLNFSLLVRKNFEGMSQIVELLLKDTALLHETVLKNGEKLMGVMWELTSVNIQYVMDRMPGKQKTPFFCMFY